MNTAHSGPTEPRPSSPTVAQIREVSQPESIRGRTNAEHWVADVYLRKYSPYLTKALLRTPISANGVTWIMILTGASAGLALLIPGIGGALLAAALGQLQMLVDCCDGEVARWRQTFSPAGTFLDKIGHYTAEGIIPLALGIRAAGGPAEAFAAPTWWVYLGALLSVLVLYNKALNDMVHASRLAAGLSKLPDRKDVGVPSRSALARLRSLSRFVPFNKIFHSVEMTLIILVAAIVDAVLGGLGATRLLLVVMVLAAAITIPGHIAAILTSSRLKSVD